MVLVDVDTVDVVDVVVVISAVVVVSTPISSILTKSSMKVAQENPLNCLYELIKKTLMFFLNRYASVVFK